MPLARTIFRHTSFWAALALACCGDPVDAGPTVRIAQRGIVTLPQSATDSTGKGIPSTGLSGITWLGDDRYAAVMDNSNTLLLFRLPLSDDGTPREPTALQVITLAERHDYEDVAVCPAPLQRRIAARQLRRGSGDPGECLLVAEEDTPAIRAVSLSDGSLLGVIPLPEVYSTRRLNRGLESLTIDVDGLSAWTANEEALAEDGPSPSPDAGTVVRLTRIPIPVPGQTAETQPTQFAYAVDPPHRFVQVFPGEPLSGVTALADLGAGQLLVLERSGCPGLPPFESRIYLADTRDAVDVSAIDRDLASHPDAAIPKTLIWKDQLGCNLEGLTLGPRLKGSSRALLAIADNNGIGTPNQVVVFTLENGPSEVPVPVPMIVGAAAVAAVLVGALAYGLAR